MASKQKGDGLKRIRINISKIILIEVLILFVLIGTVVSNAQEVNNRSAFKVKPISLSVHLVKREGRSR